MIHYPIKREIKQLLALAGTCLFIIILRLIQLQIIQHSRFFDLGTKNFLRHESIPSPRGNILDCHGELLATNKPVMSLCWQGTGNRHLSLEQTALIKELEELLDHTLSAPHTHSKIIKAEKSKTIHCLMHDIPLSILSKIMERFAHSKNIAVQTHFKRFYPNSRIACHTLGYINHLDLDAIGKMGLEKIINNDLAGQKGALLKKINSLGTYLEKHEIRKAHAGQTIITTLDLSLQKIAEALFPEQYTGCFIVMDPEDGALRALVSRPNFDPSLFLQPISHEEWQTLQQGQPFLNRAFNALYPPASIFKLITLSAALEHNYISAEDTVFCKGFVPYKGRNYHCALRCGHGNLSMKESIAKSCNALFYELGIRMPIDLLADYAMRFGLGQKTNVLFSEQAGLVPSSRWKLNELGERWWQGETLSATIGQSYLLVTPIQVVCLIGSIFTGYRVQPRILMTEEVQRIPLDIQPNTLALLRDAMHLAVQQGTGKIIKQLPNMKLHAKTGTAQVTALAKRKLDPNYLEHAWFACHLQYKDHKPLVMMIVLEHAGAARYATQYAKRFLVAYKKHMDERAFL